MSSLNQMEEEFLQILLNNYDGNSKHLVVVEHNDFPEYMRWSVNKMLVKLRNARVW